MEQITDDLGNRSVGVSVTWEGYIPRWGCTQKHPSRQSSDVGAWNRGWAMPDLWGVGKTMSADSHQNITGVYCEDNY